MPEGKNVPEPNIAEFVGIDWGIARMCAVYNRPSSAQCETGELEYTGATNSDSKGWIETIIRSVYAGA